MKKTNNKAGKYRETAVLSIVPCAVGILTIVSWIMAHWEIGPNFLNAGLALFATLFGGYLRFVSGFKDIFSRKITVNVFVTVALVATIAVGEFRAAAIVVFIMAVAGALETYTLDKTRRSIRNLLDLTPRMATVRRNSEEVLVPVNEVQVGDTVVVRPGGRIPVDGIVVACPCAFAIATPTAVTAGISNMARRAVLIKGGVFLELAKKMDVLLVDKTGTFTFGKPKVVDIVSLDGMPEQKLQFVEKLQKQGKIVGMIGDGINDAPRVRIAITR